MDPLYMHRCLQLAQLGAGLVAPNPMVGAVLVYEGRIIGEGYHKEYGGPHAEVNCINAVAAEDERFISKSTLYISLEPCTHFGKTPPCTDLILSKKIPSVVIGCNDPFEKVNGSGISKLKDAGVEVTTGVLEKECREINKRFFTFHEKQRPYIILKWAQSADGFIGRKDERTAISNREAGILVHKWRSEEAAIMAGTQTIITDNPALTTRLWPGNHPLRVVPDRFLRINDDAVILKDEFPTIIINSEKQEENGNKLYYKTGEEEDLVSVTISLLHQRNIISLIVEGGTKTISSFITAGIWDEARIIVNTEMMLYNGVTVPILPVGKIVSSQMIRSNEIRYIINPETI